MELSANRSFRWMFPIVLHLMVASTAVAGIVTMQRATLLNQTFSTWAETPQQAEQQESLRLDLLSKMPSFGFQNLIANWTFLNFLQYYGDESARTQTGYTLSPKYFDVITKRDPRFVESYLFLSGSVSHQLGKPELTLQYMKRGTDTLSPQMHPNAFTVWRFAALDQLLLLGDFPAAVRSLEMAANWAAQTPENREFASSFQRSADFLKTNPDARFVRFGAWSMVYTQASSIADKPTMKRAKQALTALGGVEKVNDRGETSFVLPEALQPKSPK